MAMCLPQKRYEWVIINCLSMFILQVLSPRNGYVLAAKDIQVGHDKLSISVYIAGSVPKKWLCVGCQGDTSGS